MTPTDSTSPRPCAGFSDFPRWCFDLLLGIGLGLLGMLTFGHRPRGCRAVPVDTAEGEYHGCGRACRYARPSRFAPLCQNTRKRTSCGRNLVLCGIGYDPRFGLPFPAFLPIACFFVALMAGLVFWLARATGEQEAGPRRTPLSLERLLVPNQPGAEAMKPSPPSIRPPAPAKSPEAPVVEHATPPPALERFRQIQSGPRPEDKDGNPVKNQ
ncbi:MAG: hypothetical protein RBU25_01700 [Lentisphaeria bacterium]|jgi:hypothetical protein|nr:hypothetical protein [Lentisphaeria bacterium]